MLDQDNLIAENYIFSQLEMIGEHDVIICNGYKMLGKKKKVIYRSNSKQLLASKPKIYLYAANQIVSPGHCLIKKEAVPKDWYRYIIKDNR